MDDVVEEFLVESYENLDQLDQDLVTLEAEPANPDMLSRIFRTIHTLKGSCGFLGFTRLESVAIKAASMMLLAAVEKMIGS